MTIWLVGNPDAGDQEGARECWSRSLASHGFIIDRTGSLEELDRLPLSANDRLLVAGGDGTVRSAAAACARSGATLVVLPSGTANDFARSLGLAGDPEEVVRAVLEDRRVTLDLAWIGDSPLLNVAHAGFGALVSRSTDGRHKRWFGRFSYAGQLLRRWRDARGVRGTLYCDDEPIEGHWVEIAVANGGFFGGGHPLPCAAPDDGKLEVFAVRRDRTLRLLWTLSRVRLLGADALERSRVVHRSCRRVRLEVKNPMRVTADGEYLGRVPLTVELEPGAFQAVRGAEPTALTDHAAERGR